MKLIIYISFFLLFIHTSFGQSDYKEVLAKSKAALEDGASFSLEYKLFKAGSNSVVEKLNGKYTALGDSYYLKIGSAIVMQNDDEKVMVNEDLSMVFITNSTPLGDYGQIDFEEAEPMIDTVLILNESDKSVSFLLQFKKRIVGMPYSKIELTIDKTTYLTKNIKLYYAEEVDFSGVGEADMGRPVLEINYLNGKKGGVSEDTFNSSHFYKTLETGEPKGVGRYTTYEIINQKL